MLVLFLKQKKDTSRGVFERGSSLFLRGRGSGSGGGSGGGWTVPVEGPVTGASTVPSDEHTHTAHSSAGVKTSFIVIFLNKVPPLN